MKRYKIVDAANELSTPATALIIKMSPTDPIIGFLIVEPPFDALSLDYFWSTTLRVKFAIGQSFQPPSPRQMFSIEVVLQRSDSYSKAI